MLYEDCSYLTVKGLTVKATVHLSGGGIVLQRNSDVMIADCYFETTGIPVDARGQMNAEVKVIHCKTSSGAEVKVQNVVD